MGTSFVITFRIDIYTEKYLRNLGLNERQVKAVMYVKANGKIASKEYQDINSISRQMAAIDLSDMVGKGVFTRTGKAGKGIAYQLTIMTNKRPTIDQNHQIQDEDGAT